MHFKDVGRRYSSNFVKGRSLVHNVLVWHDLLRHYNGKKTSRYMMKIDLRKAYDMVRWDFTEDMLNEYSFPKKFTHLVMTCIIFFES